MSTGSDSSVIRKKAQSGREDFDARAMSWSKAMRLSLERVSDRLFDLQLAVRTVEQVDTPLADLKEVASGDRLVMLLDAYGPMPGDPGQNTVSGRGAAIFDRALVQTLVEVQTRGAITQAELEERPYTYTDAAVTAQLIDPVLASVDDMMVDTPQSPDPLRFRYGSKVEDARALLLALEAPDYVLFRIGLDIEEGARSSDMVLAIPEEMLRPPPLVPDPDEADMSKFDLSGMALSAPIALNAVVARLNMPLSRVSALKPGDLLPVERSALTKTELVGSKGFVLGKMALGQMNGFRAVRVGGNERDGRPLDALPDAEQAVSAPPLASGAADGLASIDMDGTGTIPDLGMPSLEADLPADLSMDLPADLPGDLPGDLAADLPTDLPSDLSEDLPEGLGAPLDMSLDLPSGDGPELGDLADLSGLDDATMAPADENLPGLPDLPDL